LARCAGRRRRRAIPAGAAPDRRRRRGDAVWSVHGAGLVLFAMALLLTGADAGPLTAASPAVAAGRPVVVASKVFTESVVLGEILTATLRSSGVPAVHRRELG